MTTYQRYMFVLGQIRVGLGAIRRSGVLQSLVTGRPVDRLGNPIPWLSYSAIHQLESLLRADDRVVEFGSGHSTLWFSERVHSVVSVETDAEWATRVRALMQARSVANVQLIHVTSYDERRFADLVASASVILIDGAWREEVGRLAASPACGARLVIIDNTDVEPWCHLPKLFEPSGAIVCRHRSLIPCLLHESETTLVYRR